MVQRNFTQLNLGFYVNKGPLVTGMWFRQTFGNYNTSDAVILLMASEKIASSLDIVTTLPLVMEEALFLQVMK